jgi:hypothetical protein
MFGNSPEIVEQELFVPSDNHNSMAKINFDYLLNWQENMHIVVGAIRNEEMMVVLMQQQMEDEVEVHLLEETICIEKRKKFEYEISLMKFTV